MYNRYIPSADGGYIRQTVGSAAPEKPARPCPQASRSGPLQLSILGLEPDDLLILGLLLLLLREEDPKVAVLAAAAYLLLR